MSTTSQNTFYLFVARTYHKLIALVYYFLLARYLGVENFGKIIFTISFVTIFAVLMDLGLGPVLTREIARDRTKTSIYLGNVLGLKLLLSILVAAVICLIINIAGYPALTKILIYLGIIYIVAASFGDTLYQSFRGYFNFKYEAIGIIICQTAVVISGFILMKLGANLTLMFLPYILGSLLYLVNALKFFKRCTGFWLKLIFDKELIKNLLKISLPFFIAGLFATLYLNIDTVLLSHLAGDQAVGWYGAAKKLPASLWVLIPTAFSAATYPALSRYFISSHNNLSRVFQKAVFYLLLIAVPIVLGTLILAGPIIKLIYGINYLPAATALKILILAIPFVFLDCIIISLLNACNRQKINMINQGMGVGMLIIFSFILIPLLAHKGAALAYLISYLALFGLEFYWVLKLVSFEKKYLIKKINGILLSSLIMTGGLLLLREKWHLFFLIVAGMIIYFGLIYILGVIRRQDILAIKNLILPRPQTGADLNADKRGPRKVASR